MCCFCLKGKKHRKSRYDDKAEKDIFMPTIYGLYRSFMAKTGATVTSNIYRLKKFKYPLQRVQERWHEIDNNEVNHKISKINGEHLRIQVVQHELPEQSAPESIK